MNRYLIIPACILLTAAGPGFPTNQEQAKIAEPYRECLRTAAERIDDGSADFSVVSDAIAKACSDEFAKMIAALGKNLSSEDRRKLESSQSELGAGYAAAAVGRLRFDKRKTSNP